MASIPDIKYLERTVELALEAERQGNLPIGALIVLRHEVIAEGASGLLVPRYDPGRHAETEALSRVPVEAWPTAREMTCYTSLEPCIMCFGSLLLRGVGRVVFGAKDPEGGASAILAHLPAYYSNGGSVPEWIGPLLPEQCDPLYWRTKDVFDQLPCGRSVSNQPTDK